MTRVDKPSNSYWHIFKVHSVHTSEKGDRSKNRSNRGEDEQDAFLLLRTQRLDQIVDVAAAIGAVLDVVEQLLHMVLHIVQIQGNAMGKHRVSLQLIQNREERTNLVRETGGKTTRF